jgi:hypothetical protein
VVSYVDLLDDCQLMDVSGMELVLVLRGRLHNGCFEEVFFPSFYSSYEQFQNFYHLRDDNCYTKWVEVVLPL